MNRPKCSSCGNPMLASMCIAYNEYICVPCGLAEEFFNGLDKIETTEEAENELREKYRSDIKLLAFTRGGATCSECNNRRGNNCETCKLPDALEFWGKGMEKCA